MVKRINLSRTKALKRSSLNKKLQLYRLTALRTAAEFDNYRKRTNEEEERRVKQSSERILKKFIPLFENFNLAVKNIEKNKNELLTGIQLIYNQFRKLLKEEGVEFIEENNVEFNPKIHEAVATKQDDKNAGKVIEILGTGFKLYDKVIKPAKVVVGVKKENKKGDENGRKR